MRAISVTLSPFLPSNCGGSRVSFVPHSMWLCFFLDVLLLLLLLIFWKLIIFFFIHSIPIMLLHFPAHQSPLEMENNTESYDEITDSLSTLLFHYSVLLLLFSHATKYCIAGVCLSVTDFIDALLSVCMRHVQRKTLCQFNSIGFLFSKTWFQTPGFVTAYFAPISLSFHSLLFWNIWIDFSIEKFLMDFCYTHVWSSIWYLLVLFKYSIIKWFKLYIDFFSSVWHWDNLFTNDRPTQLNSVSMTLLYNCDVGIFFHLLKYALITNSDESIEMIFIYGSDAFALTVDHRSITRSGVWFFHRSWLKCQFRGRKRVYNGYESCSLSITRVNRRFISNRKQKRRFWSINDFFRFEFGHT